MKFKAIMLIPDYSLKKLEVLKTKQQDNEVSSQKQRSRSIYRTKVDSCRLL